MLKFIVFIGLGVLLLYWAYKDQPFDEVVGAVKGANYFWILLSMILGLFSHMSRAYRWNIIIEPLGYKPRFWNSFLAVMVMYLANLALPRLGEVTRCGVVKRYEGVPFTKLLGTVFVERIIDMIMLLLLLLLMVVTQFDVAIGFLDNNPEVKANIMKLVSSQPLIIGVLVTGLVFLFVLYKLRHKFSETVIYKKVSDIIKNFIEGLKTVYTLKRRWAFILHSVIIWILYYLMTYVCFYAFDTTEHLGISVGLVVFVLSSFGMVAPVSGGIGAWHFMAIAGLLLFNVPESDAGAFALVVHGSMTLLLLIVGFISLAVLPIYNKDKELT